MTLETLLVVVVILLLLGSFAVPVGVASLSSGLHLVLVVILIVLLVRLIQGRPV